LQVGRITADEFDQRSGRALAARTGKQLTELVADLPLEHIRAAPATGQGRGCRVLDPRITVGAAAAATAFAAVAGANAQSRGRSPQ